MREELEVGAAAQRRGMMDANRKTEENMVTACVGFSNGGCNDVFEM